MDTPRTASLRKRLFYCVASAMIISLSVAYFPSAAQAASRFSAETERWYRAVYVLQCFGGPAAEEEMEIPAKIRRSDEAESLRFHPDRPLVLRTLAADLEDLAPRIPEARLFAAYARLSLGERRQAADLLSRYVSESAYSARHYEILCDTLQSLRDATGLYLICREWEERDPACRPQRLLFTWTALFSMGRFDDARKAVSRDAACLGTDGPLYAARAAEAAGDHKGAEDLVEAVCRLNPENTQTIRAAWQRLRTTPVMPAD